MKRGTVVVAILLAGAVTPATAQRPLPGRYMGSTQFVQLSDDGASNGEFGLSLAITGPDTALVGKLSLRPPGGTPITATLTGARRPDGHFRLRGDVLGSALELEGAPDGGSAIFGRLSVTQGGDPFVTGSWRATRQ